MDREWEKEQYAMNKTSTVWLWRFGGFADSIWMLSPRKSLKKRTMSSLSWKRPGNLVFPRRQSWSNARMTNEDHHGDHEDDWCIVVTVLSLGFTIWLLLHCKRNDTAFLILMYSIYTHTICHMFEYFVALTQVLSSLLYLSSFTTTNDSIIAINDYSNTDERHKRNNTILL